MLVIGSTFCCSKIGRLVSPPSSYYFVFQKEIHVRLDESDISDVAPKLLSSFSKVAIYGTRQITGQLSTICKAIEVRKSRKL